MERFQQENRNKTANRTKLAPSTHGMYDPDFGSSLPHRPAGSKPEVANTSRARVGEAQRLEAVKGKHEASESSSDDELNWNADRPKPAPAKKRDNLAEVKPRAVNTSKEAKEKTKTPAKPKPIKATTGGKDKAKDNEEPKPITLAALIREKEPLNRRQPSSVKRPNGNLAHDQAKGWNNGSIDDIQELEDSSNSESDKRPILPLKPRPFPMNLSPPKRKQVQYQSRSGTTMPPSPSGSKGASTSNLSGTHTPNVYVSSDSEPEEDVDMSYTQVVKVDQIDPDLLCPFCDEPLPQPLSTALSTTLERLKRTAGPQPRWGNKKGLVTNMDIYVSFCSRHEAESKEVPKGEKYGWPQTLNTLELASRVRRLKHQLQAIINDPEEGTFFKPLKASADQHGKNSITGAKGTWVTFENASTGYYGEQGLAIIAQVLFDLFPDIPADKIFPLEVSNYRSLVLVPETALLLIQQDLQKRRHDPEDFISRSEALRVLRKSTKYGLTMFPILEGEVDNVADDLARKRASRMRKQREMEQRMSSGLASTDDIVELSSSDGASPVRKKSSSPTKQKREFTQVAEDEGNRKKRKIKEQELSQEKKHAEPTLPERKPGKKIILQPMVANFITAPRDNRVQKGGSFEWLLSPKERLKGPRYD